MCTFVRHPLLSRKFLTSYLAILFGPDVHLGKCGFHSHSNFRRISILVELQFSQGSTKLKLELYSEHIINNIRVRILSRMNRMLKVHV